jgi:GDP-4-dehydro-6-deoxy-D-mannose reductase
MNRPLAFITGIAGFAGSHLAEELLAAGYRVSGALYKGEATVNIAAIKKQLTLVTLDIVDERKCRAALLSIKPDFVFHLAAIASVGRSFALEQLTFKVNVEGTVNLLAAAAGLEKLRKFVYVSSADAYGAFSPKGRTLDESQPFNPVSPYGLSKALAEETCRYYCRCHGLPVVVARSFNHAGPRQDEHFVIPSFARQIALIEAGRQEPVLRVGDLTVKRDLSDVRDIVRGYRLLAEQGRPGEAYHLSSGKAVTIRQVLNGLLALSWAPIAVRVDRNRLRRNEIPVLRGSHDKVVQELGYAALYNLKTTLKDTLEFWRQKVNRQ